MYLKYSGITDIGPSRKENQDYLVVAGKLSNRSGEMQKSRIFDIDAVNYPLIFFVVDGMGGYAGGNKAAELVAMNIADVYLSMKKELFDEQEWSNKLTEISTTVSDIGSLLSTPMMGAALAVLCFSAEGFASVNVGDCRTYRLMRDIFVQLSTDDTSPIPGSGGLTKFLGGIERLPLNPHFKFYSYAAYEGNPERFLVCSDGLYNTLDEEQIKSVLKEQLDIELVCQKLTARTRELQPQDNYTFIIIEVGVDKIY